MNTHHEMNKCIFKHVFLENYNKSVSARLLAAIYITSEGNNMPAEKMKKEAWAIFKFHF